MATYSPFALIGRNKWMASVHFVSAAQIQNNFILNRCESRNAKKAFFFLVGKLDEMNE